MMLIIITTGNGRLVYLYYTDAFTKWLPFTVPPSHSRSLFLLACLYQGVELDLGSIILQFLCLQLYNLGQSQHTA